MPRAARVDLGPSGCVALACLALAACAPDALVLRRADLIAGEWWRVWTGQLVHWSATHAVLDAAVVALCGAIAERRFGRGFVACVLLVGAAAIGGACLAATPIDEYRGASGLGVLLGVLAGAAVWIDAPAQRGWLIALALAFGAKTCADAWLPALTLTLTALPPDVRVAWPAHVAGATVAALALGWRRGARGRHAASAAAAATPSIAPACASTR